MWFGWQPLSPEGLLSIFLKRGGLPGFDGQYEVEDSFSQDEPALAAIFGLHPQPRFGETKNGMSRG